MIFCERSPACLLLWKCRERDRWISIKKWPPRVLILEKKIYTQNINFEKLPLVRFFPWIGGSPEIPAVPWCKRTVTLERICHRLQDAGDRGAQIRVLPPDLAGEAEIDRAGKTNNKMERLDFQVDARSHSAKSAWKSCLINRLDF